MFIVSIIVIALALGIVDMLLFRRCAEATPVRLSAGLALAFIVAAIHVLLLWVGSLVGSLLRLESPDDPAMYSDIDAYIFLGMTLVVVLKMLVPYLRREPHLPLFNLHSFPSVLAMATATGINVLLLGIGIGFVDSGCNPHWLVWPLLVSGTLLGYLGLMFGRQHVEMRPRRWMVVACVLLLGVAIAATYNATH